jgi:hypothetical protein
MNTVATTGCCSATGAVHECRGLVSAAAWPQHRSPIPNPSPEQP